MVEIEKSVIRPTYAEWVDIYSENKEISFERKQSIVGGTVHYDTIKPLEVYKKALEENKEIQRDQMPNIGIKDGSYDMLRLKGFNSMKQAKKYIAVMKNPNITNIVVFIDGEEDIVKLDFIIDEPNEPVETDKYIFSPNRINYSSGQLLGRNNEVIGKISAETTRVKLFDFENSERVDVYFAEYGEAGYDPINNEYSDTQTDDFLPTVKILTEYVDSDVDFTDMKKILKENNVYFIPNVNGKFPKALNRLTSGKKIISTDITRINPKASRFNDRTFNQVLPQLEPLPNEYKKYEEQLNEVFEPKSAKKLMKRMQYLTRLEARKTREGRGVGKYTGDRRFDENRPKLYFNHTLVSRGIYSPQTKRYEAVNILAFFIERDGKLEPADDMMLFVNEAFVPSYFAESDRNKDWARISWNIAKDAVESIISYAKDLQVRYRSRKKINFDTMSEKMINAFDTNLNEIMENSFFSFMSFDKRRGKRLKVRKSNMLKSATEIKNTFETILRETYGPFKQFKELDKRELVDFIYKMNHQEKKTYDFEDTRFNIQFNFIPVDDRDIQLHLSNSTGLDSDARNDILNRANALDGDFKQYFGIRNITKTEQSDHIGILVICYFFNGDEMDRIEAVSLTAQRVEYRPRLIQQVNKDISIEYPADEIGVFMYEIMTGMRRDRPLIMATTGGSPSASPSKVSANFFREFKDETIPKSYDFYIDNFKYNEIRNEFVGFMVGQNAQNKMFYFMFSDSTLRGATSIGMICIGKLDLFYKLDGRGRFQGANITWLSELKTFEDFTKRVTIGLGATQSGSCIHFHRGAPKNDQLFNFAQVFLGGDMGGPKDFLEGNINATVMQGGPVGGNATARPRDRVELHYQLYKKFGMQFEAFIRDKIRKAVESNEIKLGAKYVKSGSSTSTIFDSSKDNHAIIYTPPKTEESVEQGENLSDEEEAMRLFRLNMGRDPDFRRQEDLDMFEELRNQIGRLRGEIDD